MERNKMTCPKCKSVMKRATRNKDFCFRGVNLCIPYDSFVCPTCGLEAANLEQTADIQKTIADSYREQMGLLTGPAMVAERKRLKLTQAALAEQMHVGIASIKRWEGCTIQSKSMDKMLKDTFAGSACGNPYTGNRGLSLPRVKLVLKQFEKTLGRRILKKNDRMLFAAKYLWYADMAAFSESGEGMSGATYAALPYGPQMNNYRELINSILDSDESGAEPLSDIEKRIIKKIADKFPTDQKVFDAAHREKIWKEKSDGTLIPYTDAERLIGI